MIKKYIDETVRKWLLKSLLIEVLVSQVNFILFFGKYMPIFTLKPSSHGDVNGVIGVSGTIGARVLTALMVLECHQSIQ